MLLSPFLPPRPQTTRSAQAAYHRRPWPGLRILALCLAITSSLGWIQPAGAALIWQIQVVDSAGNVGRDHSLVLDSNGFPVISYFDLTNADLKLVHCGDATCSSGNTIRVVDSSGAVGGYNSLALDSSGNPVISYFDFTNGDLKLAHCGDPTCSSGNIIQTVDSSDDVGWFSALRLDSNGRPVITYFDATNFDLKLARCGNPTCSSGNIVITLDSGGTVGRDPSLRLDSSGRPVISYYDITNGDLKFVRCGSATCSGNTFRTLDSAENVGEFSSLALDSSGNPVISYHNFTNGDLKLVHCGDATCSSGSTIVTVDSVGRYTSLALDSSGKPVISYYDASNSSLKLVHCGDANCSSGNNFQTVDNTGSVGFTNSLALDSSGKPVIAYYDEDNGNLKVARLIDNSPPPSVTINQAAGQADPTSSNPVLFSATFSEPVTGFTETDVTLSGTANLAGVSITVSGGPSDYTISVNGLAGSGTVVATIAAGVAVDSDGNLTTASTSTDNSVTVNFDSTPPVITPVLNPATPNGQNGWYISDVTVSFTCTDEAGGSGLATNTVAGATLSTDGANQNVTNTGTCTDNAGNTATPVTVSGLNLDKTPPTLAPVVSPNPVLLGTAATVTSGAADGVSGIASESCGTLDTSTVGIQSVTCTATDNAGNTASVTINYQVVYAWNGFFQPVDNLPTVNTVNAGQAIPVRFSLGGDYGLTIFAPGYPASHQVSCASGGSGSSAPIEETVTAGNSTLQYDAATQTYSYIWKTDKAWAGTCRQLIVRLVDGTDHSALFQFNGKVRSADAEESAEAVVVQQIFLPLVNR
ncbi:MAG: hypothetical protein DYG89_28015 [Caldilinea sp. CFX5]|nr:hypothetical protein [Caldilinea sp. CFX5]